MDPRIFELAGAQRHEITVDGRVREYFVHETGDPERILLCFHGFLGDAEDFFAWTGLNDVAGEIDATAVYLQGIRTWWRYTPSLDNRDLRFANRVIGELNPSKIFAAGFSKGGGFSYLLCAFRSDIVAACLHSAFFRFYPELPDENDQPGLWYPNAPKAETPLIFVCGTRDRIAGYRTNLRLAQKLTDEGRKVETVWTRGAGHIYRWPEIELEQITEFFEKSERGQD
jgi:predicted esterase